MAKSTKKRKGGKVTKVTRPAHGRPRSQALPGMEDRGIKALDDVAESYADIRDQRMELTRSEAELKQTALKLMKKFEKTLYRHDGIEIHVVPGEDDVKVRIRKAGEEDEDAPASESAKGEHADISEAAAGESAPV